MRERWLPVVGYEGAYEVSSRGRVRSVDRQLTSGRRRKGCELRQRITCWGYPEVQLRWADKPKHKKIHTLVLEAFVGPREKGMEARHLDGNKLNNALENLAWGSSSENKQDSLEHGTFPIGSRSGSAKLTDEQIVLIFSAAMRHPSRKVGEIFGVSGANILSILRRETFAHVPVPDALIDGAHRAMEIRRRGLGRR